jgi:hypothetical protein
MRCSPRNMALIAVTASAFVPAAAAAKPGDGAYGVTMHDSGISAKHDSGTACGKDYSRNSATGDYCAFRSSSPTSVTSPTPAAAAPVVTKGDGFSWGDAGAGAGGALVLVLVAAGGTTVLRRRHASSTITRAAG